jgi:hypothetical protein
MGQMQRGMILPGGIGERVEQTCWAKASREVREVYGPVHVFELGPMGYGCTSSVVT